MSSYPMSEIPAPSYTASTELAEDDTKKDYYGAEVTVARAERGGEDDPRLYDTVPDGVDPRFVGEDRTVRGLSQRHIQMISLAGAIGTGLFLSSGKSIRRAGPAGTLIGYAAVGGLVMAVMSCIGELSSLAPISGAYIRHAEFFVDPALGFAIGWSSFYGSAVSVPSEWTSVAILMTYWTDVNAGIWFAVCIVVTFATNLFLVRIYGEVELVCAMLKILLILGLILFGLIYDLGGIAGQSRLGFHYWKDPGAWGEGYWEVGTAAGRFCGFWLTLINAVYAYSGVESIAIAAAETKNPRRNIPRAAKRVFIRVTVFYILCLFVVGLIVPSNDSNLLTSTGTAASSPFVIAAQRAGVKVLPSIINAVIVTSAWSSGNHAMLVGSRSLYALALEGKAPKIFRTCSRYGIPYVAVLFQGAFQLLAFMSLSNGANTVFSWLTNVDASSTLTIWITIGIANWRMNKAMKVQGIDRSELPWAAPLQPFMYQVTIWGSALVLITGGFYSFLPGYWSIADFFTNYAAIIQMVVFYFGWKWYKGTKVVPLDQVPIREYLAIAAANPEPPSKPRKGPLGWLGRFMWD
ncbi:hypothetical protein Q5752_006263 [Cryptotrichosporon argae]